MLSKSQVKYIQSLDQKKYRDEELVFIAEGPKLVKEILQSKNAELKNLYALNHWIVNNKEFLPAANITEVDETELER
ncbi:MAG TPA: RNA methyltransferase, partial [Chitinophagaceae bacterium]